MTQSSAWPGSRGTLVGRHCELATLARGVDIGPAVGPCNLVSPMLWVITPHILAIIRSIDQSETDTLHSEFLTIIYMANYKYIGTTNLHSIKSDNLENNLMYTIFKMKKQLVNKVQEGCIFKFFKFLKKILQWINTRYNLKIRD